MENNIEVLYEDENFLVINKPSGLVVHPDGKNMEHSLTEWILENYSFMKDVGEPLVLNNGEVIKRPGVVHRLDRETSGVMVLAKNQNTYNNLKKQFQDRRTKKIYKAFVYGEVKNEEGVIERPIGRSSKFGLWSAQRGARGFLREAVTEYKVIAKSKDYSFLELQPKTGRTHQIRVHLKAINHPVVSDSLYAPKKTNNLGFRRLALHAEKLTFYDLEGKAINIESKLPSDFHEALKKL
jgi:23S rRNA pseudouridine1911/1915/1917 synthase